ncbi:MAG: hypothetical protein AAF919_10965 [Pseudomonadota bacterium]
MTKRDRLFTAMLCSVAILGGGAQAQTAAPGPSTVSTAGPVAPAAGPIAALIEAARMEPLMRVVATEGARHGLGLEATLFPGKGGDSWSRAVSQIQSPDRLLPILRESLRTELRQEDMATVTSFLTGDLGQRIVQREVVARREMLDRQVEAEAKKTSAALWKDGADRAALIEEMIDTLDLVTVNVSGGLNANFAFYRGLADGGALKKRLTEREMLAMVWSQEDDVRRATRNWLRAYLTLAYAPLVDQDLRDYVDFAMTSAGRRYMAATFRGFGNVFEQTSYDLGRAAAQHMLQDDA